MPAEGGALFKGSEGTIMCGVYAESPRLIPEASMKATPLPGESIPRVEGTHEDDWIRACRRGEPAGADFSYSGPLTEICALGNLAKRADARLHWDPVQLRVAGATGAQDRVRAPSRGGWELPELSPSA